MQAKQYYFVKNGEDERNNFVTTIIKHWMRPMGMMLIIARHTKNCTNEKKHPRKDPNHMSSCK